MTLNQQPVEKPVDEIGADQREHNGPYMPHALQITPKRAIKQQRQRAEAERRDKCSGQTAHFRVDAQRVEHRRHECEQHHKRRRNE